MGTPSCYTSTWVYITITVATAHVSNRGAPVDGPQMSICCQLLRSVAIETAISTASSLDAEAPLSTLINVPVRNKVANYPLRGRGEIFTVSCQLSWNTRADRDFDTKVPVLGHLKRAKAHHLALGHDEDSSEETEFNSDEENIDSGDKGANSVIALVEIVVDSRMMEGENLSSEPV